MKNIILSIVMLSLLLSFGCVNDNAPQDTDTTVDTGADDTAADTGTTTQNDTGADDTAADTGTTTQDDTGADATDTITDDIDTMAYSALIALGTTVKCTYIQDTVTSDMYIIGN